MSTRSATRRSLASRAADLAVLLLGLASVLAVMEMTVRPFYPAPPGILGRQVLHRASRAHGWEMVPDPGANSFHMAAPINAQGCREMGRSTDVDPTGSCWLLAGGGNMFGVAVAEEETYAALAVAGESTGGVPLVNTATEGYRLDQKVGRIEAGSVISSPDFILLEVEPSDLRLGGRRDSSRTNDEVDGMLLRLNRRPPPAEEGWSWILARSRLASLLDGRVRALFRLGQGPAAPGRGDDTVRTIDLLLGRETPAIDAAWRLLGAELDRVAGAADRVGARVCVLASPIPAQLRRPYPRAAFQSRLARICRERGFLVVDPLPAFREERRAGVRLYLPRLPYLNGVGHRVVAQQIRRELDTPLAHEDEGRLPSRIEE